MNRSLFICLLLISFGFLAQAQVYPPNFQCVQNDTLRWGGVANPCGIFQRYLIYGSQNKTGPYVQIASITDVNTNLFYHLHAPNQSWYYFMQSRHDCPGQPSINSDTLNGASPESPFIQRVSVEGGKTQIEWQLSSDKRVNAYIIYKSTTAGIKPIDTVFNDNKFRDLNSTPDTKREEYYLLAMDRCGSTSIFGASHKSIRATIKQDECERSAILNWNLYKDWKNGVGKQEIWVKEGNLPYVKVDSLLGKDTTFTFKGLKDKQKYCFFIRSTQKGNSKIFANTNEVCLVGNIVASTEFVVVKNLEVNLKNEVSFTWIWNNNADLDSIKIKRSFDGKTYKDISSLSVKNYASEISFTDKMPIDDDIADYSIYSLDICENYVFAPFYTINIKGKPQDNRSNTLTWSEHYLTNTTVDYELYRSANGVDTKVWENKDKFTFTDPFDPLNPDNSVLCYYVVAYAWDTLPTGKPIRVRSKSNTTCVSQTASIFTPNAFAPRGVNQEFRPKISFDEQIAEYNMEIFDRNGAKLFQTNNITLGWNGKVNNIGEEMQQGVYVYYIKIIQKNGKVSEAKGSLMLLR
jgi:gliding motility-associated-like protein